MSTIDPQLSAILTEHAVHPVPDIGDCFDYSFGPGHTVHSYRVSGWMCRRYPPPPGDDPQSRMVAQILDELRAEGKLLPPEGHGPDKVPLRFCLRHEAEYVCGSGVAGVILRVADVVVTKTLPPDSAAVLYDREIAEHLAGNPLY